MRTKCRSVYNKHHLKDRSMESEQTRTSEVKRIEPSVKLGITF